MNQDLITTLPKWVRIKKFALMTGITYDAMKSKIAKSQVAEGIHYVRAPDGNLMINWRAMDDWAEGQTKH
jgi:hypothetical protein